MVRRIKRQPKAGLLGLAFDAQDGHTRITKGDNFLLYGGSQETHAILQETAVKINERLDQRGMNLENASRADLRNIVHDVWRDIHGPDAETP